MTDTKSSAEQLPSWEECVQAVDKPIDGPMLFLKRFIYDNTPSGADKEDIFRHNLAEVLNEYTASLREQVEQLTRERDEAQSILVPTRVMQTIFGKGGNCFQACVASILNLPLQDVPHFFRTSDGGLMRQDEWDAIREFASSHGTQAFYVAMPEEPDLRDKLFASNLPYAAFGPSRSSDFGHCVVGRSGRMLHDPFPNGKFLAGDPWLYVAFEPINYTEHLEKSEQENAALRQERDTIQHNLDVSCEAVKVGIARVSALTEALRKYGRHRPQCSAIHEPIPCDCGFEALLAGETKP